MSNESCIWLCRVTRTSYNVNWCVYITDCGHQTSYDPDYRFCPFCAAGILVEDERERPQAAESGAANNEQETA